MQEIGIFCGTFNPIHWAHLLIAECARDQFKLAKILLVTSANPPHRNLDILDKESRHEMVRAATASNPYFEPSRLELDRPGPSYTVDTLRTLRELYGQHTRLNLIVGEDNLPYMNTWHEAKTLFGLCRVLVALRGEANHKKIEELMSSLCSEHLKALIEVIEFPKTAISSSLVRQRIHQGKSVLYLVPPEVHKILQDKNHYKLVEGMMGK